MNSNATPQARKSLNAEHKQVEANAAVKLIINASESQRDSLYQCVDDTSPFCVEQRHLIISPGCSDDLLVSNKQCTCSRFNKNEKKKPLCITDNNMIALKRVLPAAAG